MNYEALAFMNQQLAGMLTAGLPLEGALHQLSANMRRGPLRTELERLETDLAGGLPFDQAVAARRLPVFYTAMLRAGAASDNLPAVLLLLGDYYQQAHALWTRLKGLMVYPLIVLGTALVLAITVGSLFYALFFGEGGVANDLPGFSADDAHPLLFALLWLPAAVVLGGTLVVLALLLVPPWRQWARWKLPAFREAGLSQFASAFALMLQQGCQPREALGLLRQLEADRPLGRDLDVWQQRLAVGQVRFADMAGGSRVVPPLFVWVVSSAGEDWEGGLRKAAAIYQRRAAHHIDVLLYAALPVAILALGGMILLQVLPLAIGFTRMFDYLGM